MEKPINNEVMWAYFAPDGYLQSRSLASRKKEARRCIAFYETISYKEYEKAGYTLKKVIVNIQIKHI